MKTLLSALVLTLAAGAPLAIAAQGTPEPAAKPAAPSEAEIVAAQLPSYPGGNCVVSDEPMGGEHGEPITHVQGGRLYRLCCKSCIKLLAKSPDEFAAKLDAAVVEEQGPGYPLETCPVSGEKLGGMGAPVDVVVGTRLVRLCCPSCKPKLAANPSAALAKIDAALIEKQKASYSLETCPVSGEKLGGMGAPYDYLYGTRLVRLCCKGCVKGVQKDPAGVLAKLETPKSPVK
jgi:hypothetical protein